MYKCVGVPSKTLLLVVAWIPLGLDSLYDATVDGKLILVECKAKQDVL